MRVEGTFRITSEVGLHARPAAVFVKTASRFKSTIRLSYGDREADAKSILQVLTLNAGKGAEVAILAEGDDAQEALETLQALVESDGAVDAGPSQGH